VLGIIFAIACVMTFVKADYSASGSGAIPGAFLLIVGATFGYAAGWNPYAADYTRYLRPDTSRRATGLYAGLGVFVSCVLLETVGAGAATLVDPGAALGDPTGSFTGNLPSVTANLTLLAIALGAISANALNVYSGAMSFVALGVTLPLAARRAISALGFGLIGFVVALTGLDDAGAKYESFLLVIAYWIGPWLGVVFADQYLRRGQEIAGFLYDRSYSNWKGLLSFVIGLVVSVLRFSNQARFVGYIARDVPQLGDVTFFVGFLLAAAGYLLLCRSKSATERVVA
jgi:purine-cytosine permease-like protein